MTFADWCSWLLRFAVFLFVPGIGALAFLSMFAERASQAFLTILLGTAAGMALQGIISQWHYHHLAERPPRTSEFDEMDTVHCWRQKLGKIKFWERMKLLTIVLLDDRVPNFGRT